MASGRQLAISGLLGLVVSGCAPLASSGPGSAHVVLPAARHIQYVSRDVLAARVTITHQNSGQSYVKTFPGTALIPTAGGSRLNFVADNLPPGSYVAKLEAFLDAAGTLPAGNSTSSPFTVAAFTTTPVTLPPLVLAATPTGDWQVTLGVTLNGGYSVTGYSAELQTPGGASVAGPSGAALAATNTFTWGNVAAYPAGVSTTSLTVTATNHRGKVLTKTQVATASIAANATVIATAAVAFP